jgi:rubrerythrin
MANQTKRNLEEAFVGESQANRRYLAFARKASDEGFSNVARLFRAVAEAETIHANNLMETMGEVKSTEENVKNAMSGEAEEYTSMYPMFIDQAERDGNSKALNSFFYAKEAEKTHGDLFEKALASLKEGKDLELKEVYICTVCGYTVEGPPPSKCYTCGEGKEKFALVS